MPGTQATPISKEPTIKVFEDEPQVLQFAHIPLGDIEPNPLNPRPDYHFGANDAGMKELVFSLKNGGQKDPATVYEIPGQPGQYRLLRGHRRHAGCRLAKIATLKCNIVSAPTNKGQELEWLGSEAICNRDWGRFSKLKYALELSETLGISLTDKKIQASTSSTDIELGRAKCIFQLSDVLIDHVEAWEKSSYYRDFHSKIQRKVSSRSRVKLDNPISEIGLPINTFTPERAALIFKIFQSIKHSYGNTDMVSSLSDEEIQYRIAYNTRFYSISAMETNLRKIGNAKISLQSSSQALPNVTELLMEIGLSSGRSKASKALAPTHNVDEQFFQRAAIQAPSFIAKLQRISRNMDNIGNNPALLKEVFDQFQEVKVELADVQQLILIRLMDAKENT